MSARPWSQNRTKRPSARPRKSIRWMQLEQLEARRVLAAWNWTGGAGAGDTNWGTAANWADTITALPGVPAANDDLNFPAGPTQLISNNNLAANTAFNSINITGNGYVIQGAAIVLNTSLSASYVAGAAGTSSTLSLNIASDGDGIAVTKGDTGVLTIGGNNTYLGVTTINRGTVVVTSGNAFGASGPGNQTVVVGADAGTGTSINLSPTVAGITVPESFSWAANAGGRVTIRNTAQNNTLSGPIDVTSTGTFPQVFSDGTGALTFTGDITGSNPGADTFVIRGVSTNALNAIRGSVNLTGGALTKTDSGVWGIGAANPTGCLAPDRAIPGP